MQPDREQTQSSNRFPHESAGELGCKVRKAVMISMSLTGRVGTYTHDHYDEAHAALNELVRRADKA